MRSLTKTGGVLGMLLLVAPLAAPKAATEVETGSIVIVFKDGRQQTFRVADIARIEFNSSTERVSASQGRFLGEWRVGDGTGGTFLITLKPDGVAHKTLGSGGGVWNVVNGEARIAWDDGWHDVTGSAAAGMKRRPIRPVRLFPARPRMWPRQFTSKHTETSRHVVSTSQRSADPLPRSSSRRTVPHLTLTLALCVLHFDFSLRLRRAALCSLVSPVAHFLSLLLTCFSPLVVWMRRG